MRNKVIVLFSLLFILFCLDFFIGDTRIFLLINAKLSHPILDFAFLYVFIPLFLLLGIVPFLMLFFKNYRVVGIMALLAGPLCYFLGEFFKFSPRPAEVLPAVNLVGNWAVGNYSFPSTTTMLAFGLSLPIFFLKPKTGIFFLFLSFLIGFFVVYSGYHFPRDAIFGAIFSLIIVLILFQIKKKLKPTAQVW